MGGLKMEFQDTILQGDVLENLRKLPDNLVDCVVTSPPYWGLRDYGVGGQIGLEITPKQYINKIVEVFSEVKRVLKPEGTVFLNLGDTYFSSGSTSDRFGGIPHPEYSCLGDAQLKSQGRGKGTPDGKWLQPKQKLLIPERIAISMQEEGWLLRNYIVWYKVNHMPESVTDRLTRSWESVFFFTKSEKYYFNLDNIRREHVSSCKKSSRKMTKINRFGKTSTFNGGQDYNPLGGNPGDVWALTTEPYKEAHFATFPQKLVRRCLSCGCQKEGLVMDPFSGSGTTLYVARKMASHYLGIELNSEYVTLSKKRLITIPNRLDSFVQHPNLTHLLACNNQIGEEL